MRRGGVNWGTGSGGGGGSGPFAPQYNATLTFASHPALTASRNQRQPIDMSGGAFPATLPATGNLAGDTCVFKDIATTPTSGVYANACTITGAGGATVQNKHLKTFGATYAASQASGDTGGDSFGFVFDGTNWGAMTPC